MQPILLTKQGLSKLKKQVHILERLKFNKINNDLKHVHHDSELDSDYTLVINDLSVIEQKLYKMKTTLKNAKLAKFFFDGEKRIRLGAKVEVVLDGAATMFEIVDTVNTNPAQGKISNESPIGRALVGKTEGENIFVPDPVSKILRVNKVSYS